MESACRQVSLVERDMPSVGRTDVAVAQIAVVVEDDLIRAHVEDDPLSSHPHVPVAESGPLRDLRRERLMDHRGGLKRR